MDLDIVDDLCNQLLISYYFMLSLLVVSNSL